MKHLLVTNDFPPKVGGIQNLLWEWWRRLPPDSFAVLTSPHKDAAAFDAQQPYLIRRTKEPVLLPHPWMIQRINEMAEEIGADFIVLDQNLFEIETTDIYGTQVDRTILDGEVVYHRQKQGEVELNGLDVRANATHH